GGPAGVAGMADARGSRTGRCAQRLRLGATRTGRSARDGCIPPRPRPQGRPTGDRGSDAMPRLKAGQRHEVAFTLNGVAVRGEAEPRMLLTDFLRHVIGVTGTHVGCEHGVCGACTIRLDGVATRGCLLFAVQVAGRDVKTVEGLGGSDG